LRRAVSKLTLAATTAGAGNVTLHRMTPAAGKSLTIDWGDGSTTVVAAGDVANQVHAYAGAGTWSIRVTDARNIVQMDLHDAQLSGLKSAELRQSVLTYFLCYLIGNATPGRFDSADVAGWTPTNFQLYSMPAGYAGTFNSADAAGWTPTTFYLYSMPAGYAGTFDSADAAGWTPTDFRLLTMPAGYAGTFDSADVAGWTPTTFYLYSMPAGYAGTFDSADVAGWTPTTFRLLTMPAGYAGTFNSADVAGWTPTTFWMYSMPAGYTITAGGGFANFTTTTNFFMQGNGLLTATVDAILWELYQATAAPRTGVAGTINVAGTNAAPSGVYQPAAACPVTVATPGKEVCNEFTLDGCGVGFPVWGACSFTA